MTNEQMIQALRQIIDAIVETVRESGPMGAPGGHIYAALMTQGCTLPQYESIMSGLVRSGRLVKRGQCYFIP